MTVLSARNIVSGPKGGKKDMIPLMPETQCATLWNRQSPDGHSVLCSFPQHKDPRDHMSRII